MDQAGGEGGFTLGTMAECVLSAVGYFVGTVFVLMLVKAASVYKFQRRALRMLSRYDGPPEEWPLGNARFRARHITDLPDTHLECIQKYTSAEKHCFVLAGPLFFTGVAGNNNEVITGHPAVIKHVYSDNFMNYTKSSLDGRLVPSFVRFLGKGIFTIDHGPDAKFPRDGGKMWAEQRSTALNIFSKSLFTSYYEAVFVRNARRIVKRLQADAASRTPVDLQAAFFEYTMDSFGEIAFASEMGSGSVGGSIADFAKAFDKAHDYGIEYVMENINWLLLRELFPSFLGEGVQRFVDARAPANKKLTEQIKILDGYTYAMINKRRDPEYKKAEEERLAKLREGGKDVEESHDLLKLFMDMKREDGTPTHTDEELRDMILSFVIAGRDTTASTLTWMFYELAKPENTDVLQAVLEEIDQVLGGEVPTYESLVDLPYLKGVIYETLRLHPPVPYTVVVAQNDDKFPDGTDIPAGTRVWISSYSMGRDPMRYAEPVLKFDPQRWIPFKQPTPWEFPVFKGGRRICIGRDMAVFEASVAGVMFLQQFEPVLVGEPENYTYGARVTMSMRDLLADKEQLMVLLKSRMSKVAA